MAISKGSSSGSGGLVDAKYVDDLRSAFGNEGLLDESADVTFEFLSKSKISDHLVLSALAEFKPDSALRIVQAYYVAHGGRGECASDFSEKLWAGCQGLASTLCQEVVTASSYVRQDEQNHVLRVEGSLSRLGESLSEGGEFNPASSSIALTGLEASLIDFRVNVSRATLSMTDEVDVHAPSGEVLRKPLDQVYVDIPVSILPPLKSNVKSILNRGDDQRFYPVIRGWEQIAGRIGRAVLLGDPGGGKSTQSKKICVEYARAAMDGARTLPIFLQMRTFSALRSKRGIYSLEIFLKETVESYIPSWDQSRIARYLEYLGAVGELFIVFDGLDEVLSTAMRLEISKEIERFCARNEASAFLVTSRVVGYETAPIIAFSHFRISKLDYTSMISLVINLISHMTPQFGPIDNGLAERFVHDARRKAPDLVSNPLLLTLMVIIHSKKREIPDNRADLYSSCADLLFDRWDAYRDIDPDLRERYRLYDLLMHVAGILYEKEELGGRLSKIELKREARHYFISDYIDNREGRAAFAAERFADHITGRAWILHEVGEDVFEFTHRTFLEYFYARLLDQRHERVDEIIEAVYPFIAEGQRTIPSHIALQIRTRDKRQIANRVANILRERCERESSARLLSFSAEALNYLLPAADVVEGLSISIARSAIKKRNDASLMDLISTTSLQAPIVIGNVVQCLSMVDEIGNLRFFGRTFLHIIIRMRTDLKDDFDLRKKIDETIFPKLLKKTAQSVFAVRLLFDLGHQVESSVLEKYGVRLWMESARYTSYADQRLMDVDFLFKELKDSTSLASHPDYTRLFNCIWVNLKIEAGTYNFDRKRTYIHLSELSLEEDLADIVVGELSDLQASALLLGLMVRFELYERRRWSDDVELPKFVEAVFVCGRKVTADQREFFYSWLGGVVSIFGGPINKEARKAIDRAGAASRH